MSRWDFMIRKFIGHFSLNRILGAASIAVVSIAAQLEAHAAPVRLDPAFGQGGRVFTSVTVAGYDLFYPMAESVLVQPDGKIIVCGRFWEDAISYWYGTMIVRYMPDGTPDTSFGENGKVAVITTGYPYGGPAVGADMVLQPDGKIVLIGQR